MIKVNLNKTFTNEKDAFEYVDEIWFEYGLIGTVYSGYKNTQYVVFEEEDE
jgi:hypothetical protein